MEGVKEVCPEQGNDAISCCIQIRGMPCRGLEPERVFGIGAMLRGGWREFPGSGAGVMEFTQ